MLQSSILTIEYQYTNVLKRVFTKVVSLLRKQHVRAHAKKDTGHIDNDEYLQTYHISDRLYDRTDST